MKKKIHKIKTLLGDIKLKKTIINSGFRQCGYGELFLKAKNYYVTYQNLDKFIVRAVIKYEPTIYAECDRSGWFGIVAKIFDKDVCFIKD